MRQNTFVGNTLSPQIGRFIRRVGRPRQDWTAQLLDEGSRLFGYEHFRRLLGDVSEGSDKRWKVELERRSKIG